MLFTHRSNLSIRVSFEVTFHFCQEVNQAVKTEIHLVDKIEDDRTI